MLISLAIYDFVIIERLEMSFAHGFSVLTGETGAGKSILLDALGIALGRRGEAGLIRKGSDQAVIIVEFQPKSDHPIWMILADQGISHDGTVLIRRVLSTTGRHRSFINDQVVSTNLLRYLGDYLVEIHGQHDRLLDTTKHRDLLDEFVNDRAHLKDVAQLFQEWRERQQVLKIEQERLTQLQRDEEFYRLQLQDLEKLNLFEGEEAELLAERQQLAHLGKLWDVVLQTDQMLQGNSLLESAHSALKILHRSQIQDNAALVAATQALEKATSELTEAQSQLEEIQLQLQGQPQRLQQIDDRLHLLRSTARKYNLTIDQLPEFYQRLHRDLANLAASEQCLEDMIHAVDQVKQAYVRQSQALFLKRHQAAARLDAMVMAELPDLHLPNAQFKTAVTELPEEHWHEKGMDRVNFLVAMNKGQDLCPLERAASGGELARLMLSLKAVLTSHSMLPTIIFDEIDIGVGGAVAAAIGQRLRQLADHVQVLSITHSPQVAAAGMHHFHVVKHDLGYRVGTEVILLPYDQRSEEIARMVSGAEVTHEARAVAQTLLKKYA